MFFNLKSLLFYCDDVFKTAYNLIAVPVIAIGCGRCMLRTLQISTVFLLKHITPRLTNEKIKKNKFFLTIKKLYYLAKKKLKSF